MKKNILSLISLVILASSARMAFASDKPTPDKDACVEALNSEWKGSIELGFGPSIASGIDKHNVYNSFIAAIGEFKKHTTLPDHNFLVQIHSAKPATDGSSLSIEAKIELSVDSIKIVSLHFKGFPVLSESLDEALTTLATSVYGHQALLQNPASIVEEANMVAFNAKKALILSEDKQIISTLNLLIDQLESKKGFFEFKVNYWSRIFVNLIQAKKYLTFLAQGQMFKVSNEQTIHLSVSQAPRIHANRRPEERSTYYWPHTSSYETYNTTTMAWIYDPSYMISHPWFWGTSDQSLFAPLMMFEVMNDRAHTSTPFLQDSATTYNHNQFTQPVNPTFSGDYSNPFLASPNDASKDSSSATGYQALRDKAVDDSGTSSSTGWLPLSSPRESDSTASPLTDKSSETGWTPSTTTGSSSTTTTTGFFTTTTTGDTTTTGFTTTTGDTTTTTTTTGDSTTTTTTTGDSTTTTTTGFDSTTTTGGFD